MYTRLNTLYHFQSLRFYKEKFAPAFTEDTSFVWWPRGMRRPRLILAVVRALDPEGIPATLFTPIKQSLKRRGRGMMNHMLPSGHPTESTEKETGEKAQ